MINKIFSVLMGLLFSSACVAEQEIYRPFVLMTPLPPYQFDDSVEWRRYLRKPDASLVATTNSQWKPHLEHCLTKAWTGSDNPGFKYWLESSRIWHEGQLFGNSRRDVYRRTAQLSTPKDDGTGLEYPTGQSASNALIQRRALFQHCVHQRTGAWVTGITLPFSRKTGEQLEYQAETKTYLPAEVDVEEVYMFELSSQGGKLLPFDSTLPIEAARNCASAVFRDLSFDNQEEQDISYLKILYAHSFQLYANTESVRQGLLSLSEVEKRERYTEDFLASQPSLIRKAHTTITRYDHCLKSKYGLSPYKTPLFVHRSREILFSPDLKQHRFVKMAALPKLSDGAQ